MNQNGFLSLLFATFCGCNGNGSNEASPIELRTAGNITCVNRAGSTTCFAGKYPKLWDGTSLPDVPIVFHRPKATARVVGPQWVCLDDGKCFGDATLGSLEAVETVLKPPNFRGDHVSAHINLLCWLGPDKHPDCVGENWSYFRNMSGADIRDLATEYEDIELNSLEICGTTRSGVKCEPLSVHADESAELIREFEGYEKPCLDEYYVCARRRDNVTEVTCWFDGKPDIKRSGVLEYSCGGEACLNFGNRVECYSHDSSRVKKFEVELVQISAGTFHFCGVTKANQVLCRTLNDKGEDYFSEHRSLEFISLESWRELLAEPKSKE